MATNDPIHFKRLGQRINREVEINSDSSIVKTAGVLTITITLICWVRPFGAGTG
jgi:hypothetical protein